jgi:ribosomal protein L11
MKAMSCRVSKYKKPMLGAALLLACALVSPVNAAKFGVRVVDQNGVPVAGAAVCIGLQGDYKQFAAQFTDTSGNVMVDVPNVPLLVTVSKDRFTGVRTSEPARGFNILKEVKLKEGVPGPRCRAGSTLAEAMPNPPSITVRDIAVTNGASRTVLQPNVTGEPSHYRISANENFDGAGWKRYSDQIALVGELNDSKKVYLQMRKMVGNSKASIETVSDVVTVRIY